MAEIPRCDDRQYRDCIRLVLTQDRPELAAQIAAHGAPSAEVQQACGACLLVLQQNEGRTAALEAVNGGVRR